MTTTDLLGPCCLALLFAAPTGAQVQGGAIDLQPIPSPRHAVYSLATGTTAALPLSEGAGSCANLAPAFVNTDTSGFYGTGATGGEWLDWGVIPADTGSDILGQFTFAYGTSVPGIPAGGPGASIELSFYEGTVGFCQDSGRQPVATFDLTGLPGGPAPGQIGSWVITIDLSGGFEFEHPGLGQPFGYSFKDTGSTGATTETGPILCYAGSPTGGPDANGQVDIYDVWTPNLRTGTCSSFFFGGAPFNISSWYLELESVDAAASTQASATVRNTTNPNVYTPSDLPVLGEFYAGTALSSCGGSLIGLAYAQNAASTGTVFGDYLLGADPQLLGLFPPIGGQAFFSTRIPSNLEFCGLSLATQTFELGCPSGPELHNAVDVVLGF